VSITNIIFQAFIIILIILYQIIIIFLIIIRMATFINFINTNLSESIIIVVIAIDSQK